MRGSCSAQEHETGRVVIRNGIPHGAASAAPPPVAGPGVHYSLERPALQAFGRIAWHGPEAPQEVTGVCIEGNDGAPHPRIRSVVSDVYLSASHPRRAGNTGHRRINTDRSLPKLLS